MKKVIDVALLGYIEVGKTLVTERFTSNVFIPDDLSRKKYIRSLQVDGENLEFHVFDYVGPSDYMPSLLAHIRHGNYFMICYSITDRSSFEDLENDFYNPIKKVKSNAPIVICGNKCDLEERRVVLKSEGEKLAKRLGTAFFETSALTNTNIDEAFLSLARSVST